MSKRDATIEPETTRSAGVSKCPAKAARSAMASEFLRAADAPKQGTVAELVDFLRHNKKWWLTPIILILVLFGLLIMLAGTGAAPFIYTLF